jgi:hypothetical protein
MDQLWLVLATTLLSLFMGLFVRAHLLDAVETLIRSWTWLITMPEPAEVRAELRTSIADHVAQQRVHYLNERKLGAPETALRLLEWQIASVPSDAWAAAAALGRRGAHNVRDVMGVLRGDAFTDEERVVSVEVQTIASMTLSAMRERDVQRRRDLLANIHLMAQSWGLGDFAIDPDQEVGVESGST